MKELRLTAEVAAYIVRMDTERRGYPLTQRETEEHLEHDIRKKNAEYSLINYDTMHYSNRSWRLRLNERR